MNSPRKCYLNDFPRPFVSEDGEPDFVVVFGRDSRYFKTMKGGRFTIIHRSQMTWADITDVCGFAEIAFLLGKRISRKYSPQKRVHVANWLSNDISQLEIDQKTEKPNLIIVGSAKVNPKTEYYQKKYEDQLPLEMTFDKVVIRDEELREPKAIEYEGEEIYDAHTDHDVGLVQIVQDPESGQGILFLQGFYGKGTYGACVALARKRDWINEHYQKVRGCVVEAFSSGKLGDMLDEVRIRDVFVDQEIDDLEEILKDIEHQETLLKQHKENLRKLEECAAPYGIELSLQLANKMDYERAEIDKIEKKRQGLKRSLTKMKRINLERRP